MKKKLLVSGAVIIAFLLLDIILFSSFHIGYDPLVPFLVTSIIATILLIVLIIVIIRMKKSKKEQSTFLVGDWAAFFAITILVISTIFTFFIRPAQIDGESMLDTFHPNDRVFTYIFNYTPQKGDVCPIYVEADEKIFVKRIVATEDDVLRVEQISSSSYFTLFINDILYSADKKFSLYEWKILSNQETVDHDSLALTYQVPKEKVMALGDNFTNSKDSRLLGLFDVSLIRGKVFFIFFGKNFGLVK